MTNNQISLENCKSYATEANLDRALERLGLDAYGEGDHVCRFIKARNAEGRWTAIFLVSKYTRAVGGYIGFASQHGFMSV